MLLCRYGSINIFESLEPDIAVELIDKALTKSEEDRAFLLYATKYPYFTKKDYIPFSQFYKVHTQPISKKDRDEILKDVAEIRKKARKEGE
ncbi:hypothetical protein [Fredinandcohnia sp. 179-A 10B2 NHS]|uniref:hypothetical protein n=1 Tax=Fredinandcohnia sp. 179-A 10B2 NHS TaxID=3235176 RepID=UPI00399F1876